MPLRIHHTHWILAISLFCSTSLFGQYPYFDFAEETDSLRRTGIDTLILFSPTIGSRILKELDSFSVISSHYFIWLWEGKYKIKKISECLVSEKYTLLRFKTLSVDSSPAYNFFVRNIKQLNTDTLSPGLLLDTVDNKPVFIKVKSPQAIYSVVRFIVNNEEFGKSISDDMLHNGITYNLDGSIRYIKKNINYKKNISTSIYKLIVLLNQEIGILENHNLFKY